MTAAPDQYTEIACEIADGIATVTLDRPDRLNAFTTTMGRELIAAFAALDADDSVRVILVTGRGRGFLRRADLGPAVNTFDPS